MVLTRVAGVGIVPRPFRRISQCAEVCASVAGKDDGVTLSAWRGREFSVGRVPFLTLFDTTCTGIVAGEATHHRGDVVDFALH